MTRPGLGSPEAIDKTVDYLDNRVQQLMNERDDLIRAMRGVSACFRSRTESSKCTEDHHPSCHQYLELVLKRVTGGK